MSKDDVVVKMDALHHTAILWVALRRTALLRQRSLLAVVERWFAASSGCQSSCCCQRRLFMEHFTLVARCIDDFFVNDKNTKKMARQIMALLRGLSTCDRVSKLLPVFCHQAALYRQEVRDRRIRNRTATETCFAYVFVAMIASCLCAIYPCPDSAASPNFHEIMCLCADTLLQQECFVVGDRDALRVLVARCNAGRYELDEYFVVVVDDDDIVVHFINGTRGTFLESLRPRYLDATN